MVRINLFDIVEFRKQRRKEYMVSYGLANVDRRKANVRRWTSANKDKIREYQRRYNERNPGRQAGKGRTEAVKRANRRNKLKTKYGLTESGLSALVAAFDSKCGICSKHLPTRNTQCVDHSHATGKVRGILCRHCNLLIGYAVDSKQTLSNAIVYLERTEWSE